MRWDLFCRVIDNLGDAGVCWRLAADLGGRGETVRLVIDDARSLRRIAPGGAARVEVADWRDDLPLDAGTDVVVEAFGCNPPAPYVERMARSTAAPQWINLEYLSAEAHNERTHGLPSPQLSGPGLGLTKWFFCPGFTPASGGLLREPGLLASRATFDRGAWLQSMAQAPHDGERVVVLFSYAHPGLPRWIDMLSSQPTALLVPQGPAQAIVQATLGPALQRGALRAVLLPWLTQPQFDHLLWSADFNIVRGEDSLVRALWAGAPFVWQLYPQPDGAHRCKLRAFLERWRSDATAVPSADIREWFDWWNATDGPASNPPSLPPLAPWGAAVRAWRKRLAAQSDLAARLLGFVAGKL